MLNLKIQRKNINPEEIRDKLQRFSISYFGVLSRVNRHGCSAILGIVAQFAT